MKNLDEKLISILKSVHLNADEKVHMKSILMAQISDTKDTQKKPVLSPYFSWLVIFQSRRLQFTFASLFLVISISSTAVLGAESSLPGDLLYPIKTNFTERVQRSLVPSTPMAQVEFETQLVEKRFIEAEQLDSKQELTGDRKIQVKKGIEAQTKKAIEKEIKTSADSILTSILMIATSTISKTATTTEVNIQKENNHKDNQKIENKSNKNSKRLEKILEDHKDILNKLDSNEDEEKHRNGRGRN